MDEYVSSGLAQSRMAAMLMGIFAFVSMVLAAVGLYGLIAHSVAQRTREIGIRMALGAEKREVLRLILTEGMIQTAIGLALGIGGALALSRLIVEPAVWCEHNRLGRLCWYSYSAWNRGFAGLLHTGTEGGWRRSN
jgi:ABC-type antimicrobial peptide transport system permease subunit